MGGSFWLMIPERPKFSSTSLEYNGQKLSLFIHAESSYEIFIQAVKGYKIIGPMRA
jgi:hypothetical protein